MKNDRIAGVIVSDSRYAELEALEQKRSMARRKRPSAKTYLGASISRVTRLRVCRRG
jgi:hypothetical protein